jgi:negative regulator of flagellin synthesis FlgM
VKIQDQQPLTASQLGVGGATAPRTGERRPEAAGTTTTATGGSTGPAATVTLSSRSRELHNAREAVNAASDIREDKVASVRRQIENGTYLVDPTRIARGILDSSA